MFSELTLLFLWKNNSLVQTINLISYMFLCISLFKEQLLLLFELYLWQLLYVTGVMTAGPGGKICYDDVLHLLTCPMCTCLVSAPVTQCRRGHLFCRDCAKTLSNCSLCHQPWVETPNNTLDKIINLIALPCKYG